MLKHIINPQMPMGISIPTARWVCPRCEWEYREVDGINSFDFKRVASVADKAEVEKIIRAHLDREARIAMGKHTMTHLPDEAPEGRAN